MSFIPTNVEGVYIYFDAVGFLNYVENVNDTIHMEHMFYDKRTDTIFINNMAIFPAENEKIMMVKNGEGYLKCKRVPGENYEIHPVKPSV